MQNSIETEFLTSRIKTAVYDYKWVINTIKKNVDPEFCGILRKYSLSDRQNLRNLYVNKLILQQANK